MSSKVVRHFRDILCFPSQVRYALWRLGKLSGRLTVRLRSGVQLSLRPLPATDYGVAYDIFYRHCYRSPRALHDVRRIVDLGSNVGYSCVFWCQQFPEAQITAFEPHPVHVEAIALNLSLNGVTDRVNVIPAAAGTMAGTGYLSDAGSSSKLNDGHGYSVEVVDAFELLQGEIDLLKIDIEGGEYPLLEDERFGALRVRTVVVEWHRRGTSGDDRAWCEEALRRWGYETVTGVEDLPLAGLIWGFRAEAAIA